MSKIEISEKDSELLRLIEQLVTEGVANGIKKGIEQARNEEDNIDQKGFHSVGRVITIGNDRLQKE